MPAAGSVQSTARDMARYAVALLDQGAGIVDAASFAAMVAPQWEPHPRLTSLGLSFMRRERFGMASFGHGGGVVGGVLCGVGPALRFSQIVVLDDETSL